MNRYMVLLAMAFTFTHEQLASDLGTNTADGLRNVANTAANFACGLYQNYAKATTGFPDPTGIGAFNNALYSRMCAPRGQLPPAPIPPFNGGQCPTRYRVNFSSRLDGGAPSPGVFVPGGMLGAISGVVRKSAPNNRINIGIQGAPDSPLRPDGFYPVINVAANEVHRHELIINYVERVDSQPDTCGDPLPQYPDKAPPPGAVNNITNVNVGNNLTIPLAVVYAPIKIDADIDIYAQVQVQVGPFEVAFDLGGVTISPNFNIANETVNIPRDGYYPNPNTPPRPVNDDNAPCDVSTIEVDLDSILTKLNTIEAITEDIKECSCPVAFEESSVALGSGSGKVVPLPSNTIRVRLTLTQQPENAKTQRGGGDAPTQYFCGYYAFGDGFGLSERIPINVEQSTFEVPVWATSFCWSLYSGYVADATAVVLIPDKAGAELAIRQMKMPPA